MRTTRLIGLVDCNSFYASCEKVFRPELARRPVVVLSNNDGCIVARSPEAKKLGLKMGEPYFRAKRMCRGKGVAVFSSNYALYGDMSRRVMTVLGQYTPDIEVYSIDEAFLDFAGIPGATHLAFGRDLIGTVRRWTGIPVSLGIGPNKTLAKVANRMAKKSGTGVQILLTEADIDRALESMAVEDLWGISRRWGARLRKMGISTAGQLKRAAPVRIRRRFSVVMERLVRELRGEVCLELEDCPEPKKNITVSRSFGRLVTSLPELEEAVACYVVRAGEKLREQGSVAGGIYIYVQTPPYRDDLPQYANACSITLAPPTCHSGELARAARAGLHSIYRPGHSYHKAGVVLLDLQDRNSVRSQGDLFGRAVRNERDDALMAAVDRINREMGRGSVTFAGQGVEHPWRLRAEFRSPRYTTRWAELPVVSAW